MTYGTRVITVSFLSISSPEQRNVCKTGRIIKNKWKDVQDDGDTRDVVEEIDPGE